MEEQEEKTECTCKDCSFDEMMQCKDVQDHYHNDGLWCKKTGEKIF